MGQTYKMVSDLELNSLKIKYGIIAHTEADGHGDLNYMFVPDLSSKAPYRCNLIVHKDELYAVINENPERAVKEYAKELSILLIKAQ